ncbi:MAG TPA: alanyl-tRNA editing protein [bacterium]|nr:alanyl-tRNA editing protein [bacterium]
MTHRLYYADSYLREFDATVIDSHPRNANFGVVLDRTAFYPTSGGQPHDTGTLNNLPVIDVLEDEENRIVHVVAERPQSTVRGTVDWQRRFDHMQQHTGQHILSQACVRALGAQTRAVHLGDEVSTLDLDRPELNSEAVASAEDLANQIVFEDRPVLVREVEETDLVTLQLRRPPKKHGRIRVVEVEDFDRSACGGTHVRRTGEVGPIKVRRWERFKGGMRVEFYCGWRALRDYRWKNALTLELASQLTVKDAEVISAVSRLAGQLRDRDRVLADVQDRLVDLEARQRLAQSSGPPYLVVAVVPEWTTAMVTALAGRLAKAEATVAVLGTPEGHLVIARSADLDLDAAALLTHVVQHHGGRGGGRPAYAQGSVPALRITEAVEAARRELATRLATQ